MALVLILALVVALYYRTLNYNYVIDDNVKRNGYMYEVPLEGPPPGFWQTKPSKFYRLFMIGMHCVNVSIIYLLWGWAPALLFAVHPVSVWGTAWVTGNYYATTAYFCLIAYYILTVFPNVFGAVAAMCLFTAALNSTVCAITFPFVFLFNGNPWGLTLLFPLAMYLNGKRFRTGIKTRVDFNKDKPVDSKFTWRRLLLMTKVIARYIFACLVPEKQGFFRLFGRRLHEQQKRYDWAHAANSEFWLSLGLCLSVLAFGLVYHPIGVMWFFTIIMLHSQWNLTGQFFAERYAYLANVGLCVVAGTAFTNFPIAVVVLATYYTYKTTMFIPAWRNQQEVWRHDVKSFPENSQVHNNMAQWYLNMPLNKQPVFRINELAMMLQKAELMEPDSWEIKMNMACFFVMTGDTKAGLEYTNKSIALLEPIVGGSGHHPLSRLKEQQGKLEEQLSKGAAQASPPIKEEQNDGKTKEEDDRVLESSGAGIA